MTERQVKAIERFCEWLNMVHRNQGERNITYTVDDFTSENPHSGFEHITTYKSGGFGGFEIDVFWISDGDEGGGNYLTVYYNEGGEPWHATNMFDTMLGHWLYEGKLQFTKGYYSPDPES